MQLKYSGACFDPRQTENVLSLKLAENAAREITHSMICEENYTNLVTVVLK